MKIMMKMVAQIRINSIWIKKPKRVMNRCQNLNSKGINPRMMRLRKKLTGKSK